MDGKDEEQPLRYEENWSNVSEAYVNKVCSDAELNSAKHNEAGYHFKARKTWFGLPQTLIPLIMSPVTMALGANHPSVVYVSAGALLLTGLTSGIYNFFNYGEQTQNHFNYDALYADLASDVRSEMIKSRAFRQPADVFVARMQMRFDSLAKNAPVLPKNVIARVEKSREQKPLLDDHNARV